MKKALGLIETIGLAAAIAAADAAVKSANVTLLGYENTKGSGKITVKVTGDVGAVKAAVAAGAAAAAQVGTVYGQQIIARPHEGIDWLATQIDRGQTPAEPEPEPEAEPEPESAEAPAPAEPTETADPEPTRCAAITKSGTRCKRTATAGSQYCSIHQPEA